MDFPLPVREAISFRIKKDYPFFQAVTLGPTGLLYATSGKAKGASNLFALDKKGHVVWEAPAYQGPRDLDSGAMFSAPVIDEKGDLYLTDSNQFWAFHGNGRIKWVRPLPKGAKPAFSVQFMGNSVVAVTGDGRVVALKRATGRPAAPVLPLPGVYAPDAPRPPGERSSLGIIRTPVLVDPEIAELAADAFAGLGWAVANTPAVHPFKPRLFIAARTPEGSQILFAVDLDEKRKKLAVAFSTVLSQERSAVSPAVSPDGKKLFINQGRTQLATLDTETGKILWSQKLGFTLLAGPSVGADGTVYLSAKSIVALEPETGEIRWSRDFSFLAPDALPRQLFPDSVITVSPNALYLVVWAKGKAYFVILNPKDGSLLADPLLLEASSEAYVTVDKDGCAYVSHYGIISNKENGGGITALCPPQENQGKEGDG